MRNISTSAVLAISENDSLITFGAAFHIQLNEYRGS